MNHESTHRLRSTDVKFYLVFLLENYWEDVEMFGSIRDQLGSP